MKKAIVLSVIVCGLLLIWLEYRLPEAPSRVETAKVLALVDLDDRGKRLITVQFPGGTKRAIETHVPFFYRIGDTAHIAVHERYLLPDVIKLVREPVKR